MLPCALAALAGNQLLHQLPVLPDALGVAAALGLALAAALLGRRCRIGTPIAAAALMFAWTAHEAQSVLDSRWPESANGSDIEVAGWVDAFPGIEPARTVFSLRVVQAATDVPLERIRLSWYDPPQRLEPGMALTLRVRLRAPRGLANPGGFDYERWLLLERFAASGYVRAGSIDAGQRYGLAQRWLAWRGRVAERMRAAIASPDAAALIAALSLGERSGFGDRHWTVLQRTGTSHLVAVSGLHIGLIAMFSFVIVLHLALRLPYALARHAHALAALAAVTLAAGYAAMAGFTLPTQRALIMLVAAQLLLVTRRRWPLATGLSGALILVLALDPLASLAASIWLSFGAVAVLVLALGRGSSEVGTALETTRPPQLHEGMPATVSRRARWLRGLLGFTRVQLSLTVALLPFVIWFFGQLSFAAPLVNLLAIPLFSFVVVPLSLAAACCAALDSHGFGLVLLAGRCAGLAWQMLELCASLPWSARELRPPGIWALGTSLMGAALWLSHLPLPGRRLALAGFVPLFVARGPAIEFGQARMTVLDVGQGLAVAVETAEHRLLYDAGPVYRSGFDAGAEIVAPALAALGGRPLDLLVLSHGDADHAGGAAAVRTRYPAARVLAGPDVVDRVTGLDDADPCRAGQSWVWDGVRFSILHPPEDFLPHGNESSCVLSVVTRSGTVLLTGDIESRAEASLVTQGMLAADIVIVPHHGSATSSSAAFVAAVGAGVAVVSAGHDNQWGFPRADVRARWQARGAQMLVTGELGAITVVLERDGWRVGAERTRRRRYWQANVTAVPGAIDVSAL